MEVITLTVNKIHRLVFDVLARRGRMLIVTDMLVL